MTISAFLAAAKPRSMSALLLSVLCCAPALATAKSVTYTYKGTDYTALSGAACLTSAMATSLKFTVKQALGPNFSGTITPAAWVANDGRTKITSKTPGANSSITVGTDANGNINSWLFVVVSFNTKFQESEVFSANEPTLGTYDQAQIPCGAASSTALSLVPGTWSF